MASTTNSKPACKNLVLDAGPLLSLSPLRGLAEAFYTVPQVLDELKDKRAREHFEKLGLSAGVRIQVQSPDSASLAHGTSSRMSLHTFLRLRSVSPSYSIREEDGRLLCAIDRRSLCSGFDICPRTTRKGRTRKIITAGTLATFLMI